MNSYRYTPQLYDFTAQSVDKTAWKAFPEGDLAVVMLCITRASPIEVGMCSRGWELT